MPGELSKLPDPCFHIRRAANELQSNERDAAGFARR